MVNLKWRGQTDQDIIRACGYITDNKFIASYFGVEVKRVAQLRVEVDKHKTKQTPTETPKVSSVHWNNDAERKAIKDAKQGSAALLKALEKFFEKRLLEKAIQEQST
jgi:hypothetical protein